MAATCSRALIDLKDRSAAIDHLLIETSGVALPQSIVQSLALLPGLVIDGVIVVADAETIEERARDRYMSDTVLRQLLAHADHHSAEQDRSGFPRTVVRFRDG